MKNILIFVPILASHQFDWDTTTRACLAFVVFSLLASAVYVLNDLLDLAADRAHPRKRHRPFASGALPLAYGPWLFGGLLVSGGAIAMQLDPLFLLVMGGYVGLTTAYSMVFKRWIIFDILILAMLYTLRIVAGSVATGIPLSGWLLGFSAFFFLSLAAIKRQTELIDSARRGVLWANGRGYHINHLPLIAAIAISAGYLSVVVLGFYLNSPAVVILYAHPEALWGVCTVLLFWITRTIGLVRRGQMHDDPVIYAAKDRLSQLCLVLIAAFAITGAAG